MNTAIRYERWPGYLDVAPRTRTLALLEGTRLLTLEGEVFSLDSWEQLKMVGLRLHLEVYTSEIVDSWWFADALRDASVKVMLPGSILLHAATPITTLYAQQGAQRVWIICTRAWGTAAATYAVLELLAELFALCGVGVRPTPGSLGQALMRRHWQAERRSFVARPPNTARRMLLDHCLGGRVDYLVTPQETFDTVFEHDLTSAYCSVSDRLPGGFCIALSAEPDLACVTYYMECVIRIYADTPRLAFGVFGIKGALANEYPTTPGEYRAWLWKEEIDLCRRSGWLVVPQHGWGWTRWNTGLRAWGQHVFQLRQQAAARDAQLAAWVKQMIVASLGRFGMPLFQWKLLPEGSAAIRPGDIGLALRGEETGFVLHQVTEWNSNHLSHWFSYILMRCRLVLRARMLYEAARGNTVYASNYDAVYCRLPADPLTCGHSLGEWREQKLTRVRFPFPRGVISLEKTTLPGVKR